MKLESRQVTFEDIGRQLLCFGKHESAAEVCERIDAVTAEGIQSAAKQALKSKLTMASFGDVSKIPYYDQIAKRFN
jgi:processing peptidase subunit alpha